MKAWHWEGEPGEKNGCMFQSVALIGGAAKLYCNHPDVAFDGFSCKCCEQACPLPDKPKGTNHETQD